VRYGSIGACLLLSTTLFAQSANVPAPTFQVASILPNRSGGTTIGIRPIATGQLTAINVTLRALILRAYALHDSQLTGGPAWLGSDRFDVIAKAEQPPQGGNRDVLLMLRRLLVDRFGLRTHTETHQLPSYVLRLDRADRRLGPQMRPSTVDCTSNPVPAAPNTAPTNADGWPPCGLGLTRTLVAGGRSRSDARHSAQTLVEFALSLQPVVDRPVVNRTDLPGVFDFEYAYVREGAAVAADTPVTADAPDIFTALREQLGLRLESQTNPIDVFVIDAVAPPAAN
jgi:uncharacterized protein (TIGR03435 family)